MRRKLQVADPPQIVPQRSKRLRLPALRIAQTCAVMVVRVCIEPLEDDGTISGRGVRYLEVQDLDGFAAAQRRVVA